MKTAYLQSLVATLSLVAATACAEGTCSSGGPGNCGPGGRGPAPTDPYYPTATTVPAVYTTPAKSTPATQATATPSTTSKVRITVVDSDPVAPASDSIASRKPGVRITVVDDAPIAPAQPETKLADANPRADHNPEEIAKPEENTETIDAALKGLVGTWRAVARHGDGELTTVELQLDDRGWAELTVPAADGTKSTVKRRIELDNEELKLTSPDSELSLGKLVTFDTRQMVLQRDASQVTFVRL